MYDFLLFVHVLTAFCLAATIVIYSAFALGAPATDRTTFIAERLWDVGGLGTLVFGVWLAINRPEYEVWDGWVIAALVLWFVAFGLQRQAYVAMNASGSPSGTAVLAPDRAALARFNALRALVFLLLLIDMIFKPGA
ncbi:MAG: hypothetical protein ACJ75R_03900 [Solirubrobacterales bacterium]